MLIQVASDLHFEFHMDKGEAFINGMTTKADVLILAGDICHWKSFIETMRRLCSHYPHVILVPGNHEFYGSDIQKMRNVFRRAEAALPGALHILDRKIVTIGGQRFVGATLWFKMDPYMEVLSNGISDFRLIKRLREEVSTQSVMDQKFIYQELQKGDILITHMATSRKSIHERFANEPLNSFFVCDIESFILDIQPRMAIHGHTHNTFSYPIGDTRVVCNPFGYVRHEENPDFDMRLVFEV